jgi:transcription elongation factor GreA
VPDVPGAANLLRTVGLLADGPIVWGRPIPARGPGVFIVELPAPLSTAPLELTRIGKWIEHVETLTLDGHRPTSKELAARLSSFWLPSQTVLYVGVSATSMAARLTAMSRTVLGDRRPSTAGHWLHTLRKLDVARVWWTPTSAVEEYEDALLTAFADGVPAADLERLPDRDVILPFANLRRPTGERRATGLSGSLIADTIEAPLPATYVVAVADGDADGARGEAEARRSKVPPKSPARPAAPRAPARPTALRQTPTRTTAAAPSDDPRTKKVHLTADGIARLEAELVVLTTQKRPEVIGRIRSAKELGDLKENADYTAAREEQSFLEGRVQAIEAQLRGAVVIQAPAAGSRVGLGSVVTVETDGDQMRLEIVGTQESSPKDGRISGSSPVGRALLGGSVGDEVMVQSPSGPIGYRIVAID